MNNSLEISATWRALIQQEKEFLSNTRQKLKQSWQKHRRPTRFFNPYRQSVDAILQRLWKAIDLPKSFVLIALGGYGRSELYPYSDLDLLILCPDKDDTILTTATTLPDLSSFTADMSPISAPNFVTHDVQNKIAQWVSALWDIGFEIGHSVHRLSDSLHFAAKDLVFETSLLECRFLAGNFSLFQQWQSKLDNFHNIPLFIEKKLQEQASRHQRFSTNETNLEPNVKDLAGGLRDLHLWIWLARATGLGQDIYDFEQKAWLTRQETRQLKTARYCLQSLRIDLHFLAGRKEDRLLWNFQTPIAELWQLKDNRSSRASELLMRRYYRATQIIRQINDILLAAFRQFSQAKHHKTKHKNCPPENQIKRLNAFFHLEDGLLSISDPRAYRQHHGLILETFLLLCQHDEISGISSATLRALWHARLSINGRFRANPQHRTQFIKIFQQSQNLSHVLHMMHRYGILGRYLPAFASITGRMQHDLFHIHTVDVHILRVIQNLRDFLDKTASERDPVLARLMQDFERPEVLFLAALFHDIGKGRQGDHSILGAEDARLFAKNHPLPPEDQTLLVWLVEYHLIMSSTAQKQDVYDPQVIEQFALFVQTPRRLIALYLLTVADIRATNPKIWNAWKAKLLDTLFHSSLHRLEDGEKFDINQIIKARKLAAQTAFLTHHAESPERIWRYFDNNYFLRYEAEDIFWHATLIKDQLHTQQAQVWAKFAQHREGLDVCVYAPDTSDLFSRICQFFSGTAFNIVEARIEITLHAYALNTFHILAPMQMLDKDSLHFIHHELKKSLAPNAPLPKLRKQHKIDRHLKSFPIEPHIKFQIDASDLKTTLFIVAGDRQGLLAEMAALFARYQIQVHSAKIMTLGNRIEDIFVLSSYHLKNNHFLFQIKQELLEILQNPQKKPIEKIQKSIKNQKR